MKCPDEAALSRAFTAGADGALAGHLRTCADCQRTWTAWERAIARARSLPVRVPPPARRQEVRAALLASAGAVPAAGRRRTAWIGSVAVLATAAVVALWLGHRRNEPPLARSHASLSPAVGTRYSVVAPRPRETVRLWEGTLALEVDPLGPGERFVVEVGDGEVEVRGTKFTVIARADRLVRVEVSRGRVEVRPRGASLVVLEAGQSWTAPAEPVRENEPAARALSPPAHKVRAPVRRVAHDTSMDLERAAQPMHREAQQEAQYDDAWDALRAHDYKKAADVFGRVLRDSPAAPLANEAAFWRATALARGDDPQAAVLAFRQMLDAYPQSPRRGEASTILGWLLVAAHEPTEAAARFRAALDDDMQEDIHEDVRASAREGLEALAPRPAH